MKQISFIFSTQVNRCEEEKSPISEQSSDDKPNVELNPYQFQSHQLGESNVE
jgi:hypothetical protein